MWKRELIRNKIYAVLMVLASLPVVILERDGTVLLLSLFFGVPMFFAKENWIMGGPVYESKESRAGRRCLALYLQAERDRL